MSTQFSSMRPIDRTLSGAPTPGQNGPHFQKLQYYWSLTIRSFSVISRTLVGRVLPLCRDAVGVLYSPSRLGRVYIYIYIYIYIERERERERERWGEIYWDTLIIAFFKNAGCICSHKKAVVTFAFRLVFDFVVFYYYGNNKSVTLSFIDFPQSPNGRAVKETSLERIFSHVFCSNFVRQFNLHKRIYSVHNSNIFMLIAVLLL